MVQVRSANNLLVLAGFGVAPGLGGDGGPAGEDGGGEAAAGGEFAADDAPFGADSGDDVTEDFVDGVFVEDAEAAIGEEIHFEGFELDAIFFGHVLNGDGAEVGEAGLGADRGVFGEARGDDVAGELIEPGFESGQFGLNAGAGVLCGVVGHRRSSGVLYRARRESASCGRLHFSPMLAGESADRKSPASLPQLPWVEDPAVETPDGAGLSIWICGRLAVALRKVRNEVLRARPAGAPSLLCALWDLRQFGIATNRRGARAGDDDEVLASAANSGAAMRTVPAQVFLGEAGDERRTKSGSCAGQVRPLTFRASGH